MNKPPSLVHVEVDGWLGAQGVTAWQQALSTHADGFVSSQGWEDWGHAPNLVAAERCYGAEGSSLVSAIQRVVGADADGLVGPQTAMAAQRFLNAGAWP